MKPKIRAKSFEEKQVELHFKIEKFVKSASEPIMEYSPKEEGKDYETQKKETEKGKEEEVQQKQSEGLYGLFDQKETKRIFAMAISDYDDDETKSIKKRILELEGELYQYERRSKEKAHQDNELELETEIERANSERELETERTKYSFIYYKNVYQGLAKHLGLEAAQDITRLIVETLGEKETRKKEFYILKFVFEDSKVEECLKELGIE
jgi:hypothetical protein